jgi:hypothetical protein
MERENQIKPPRGGRGRSDGPRSSWRGEGRRCREKWGAVEKKRGDGARKDETKGTGLQDQPVIICPKQRNMNPENG